MIGACASDVLDRRFGVPHRAERFVFGKIALGAAISVV